MALSYQEQARISNEAAKKLLKEDWENSKKSFSDAMSGAWRSFQEGARTPAGEVENYLSLMGKNTTAQTTQNTTNGGRSPSQSVATTPPVSTTTEPATPSTRQNKPSQNNDDGYELKNINAPRQTAYHFDYGNKTTQQQPTQTTPKGGIVTNNQNYADLVAKLQQSQQDTLQAPQINLGLRANKPSRDWENEAQRKALLQQATTVHKGANGLTAAQMRLAHELSNDDIKLAQERYLQQNQLDNALIQEQMQQAGQNARTLATEQGQNSRFGANFGLDVARLNQDNAIKQQELGLRGTELKAKLQEQGYENAIKQELNNLYNQFGIAQTDEEKQKLYEKLGFLTGKGGNQSSPKDYLMTIDGGEDVDYISKEKIKNPQRILDTRTMQIVDIGTPQSGQFDVNNPNHQAYMREQLDKETTVEGKKKVLIQGGMSEEEAEIAVKQAMGAK